MKEHIKLGGIILMALGSSLLLSCNNDNLKQGVYVFSGTNSNYFELLVKFEGDSIYSLVNDELIGMMPGYANSVDDFNRTGNLSKNGIIKIVDFEKTETFLLNNKSLIPLKLDTVVIEGSEYINSTRYEADFLYRLSMKNKNVRIKVEGYK